MQHNHPRSLRAGSTAPMGLRLLVCVVLLLSTIGPTSAWGQEAASSRYRRPGVGSYGLSGLTELDTARFDWVYLCFGNTRATPETTQLLNRLIEINPRLKVMIRVWPIMGLGDCKENRHQATFLHYLYKPSVKERLLKNVHDQIHVVLDHIDKPENVIGSTFLEELPGHFSGYPFRGNRDGDELTWDLERFRKEIEAERGKPLRWDDETRLWWAKKWCQVIDEIHTAMKRESGGRLVFYYQQTNHSTLDMVPEGTPLSRPMLIPIRWEEIIKPGFCDGFFAYPNSPKIWQEHYVRFATSRNWLLFSQVSHPSGMRLSPWDECLSLAKTRIPQNLGYFFYCPGNCAGGSAWNADKGIPPGPLWNTRGVSKKLHIRRHLALENVGMDIVRRQPALRLHVDLPLDGAKPGGFIHPRVIVENGREESFYLDPKEALARNATVTLRLPDGFSLNPENSAPATLKLGDLEPGERRVADWWVSVDPNFAGHVRAPFHITARAEGSPPATVSADRDLAIPFAQPQEIGIPGTRWLEPAYRMSQRDAHPRIVIEALQGPVRNPAVSDGYVRIAYRGVLDTGMRLLMDPEQGTRLFVDPLVDDDGQSRADADDPTGFRCFDDGYLVCRIAAKGKVDPAVPLRAQVAGRSEDGGQSLIVLRYRTKKGTVDQSVLVNRFRPQWREVSQAVRPPETAISLANVFLYRFKSKGKVWYGRFKIERADAKPEGTDVTDRLRGSFPTLSKYAFRVFEYTDDNPPSVRPRVRVQLVVPEE
ncbi:hypothetical protein H8D79_01305 [PVC group bacterium]|nr:hypothetical protein [PVC group bacterium]